MSDHIDNKEHLKMETCDSDLLECKSELLGSEEEPNVDPLGNTDFKSEGIPNYAEDILVKEEPLEFAEMAKEFTDHKVKTGLEHEAKPSMQDCIYIQKGYSEPNELEEEDSDPQLPMSFLRNRSRRNGEYLIPDNGNDIEAKMADDSQNPQNPSMSLLEDLENKNDYIQDPDFILEDSHLSSDEDQSSTSAPSTPARKHRREDVRAKFKSLRTYFMKEFRRVQTAKSGSNGNPASKRELFDAGNFLMASVVDLPTESTCTEIETMQDKYGIVMEGEVLSGNFNISTPSASTSSPASVEEMTSEDFIMDTQLESMQETPCISKKKLTGLRRKRKTESSMPVLSDVLSHLMKVTDEPKVPKYTFASGIAIAVERTIDDLDTDDKYELALQIIQLLQKFKANH